jgi:hypothetical protein
MCDPVSIGLTMAGTALQAYAGSQAVGATKKVIAQQAATNEQERAQQQQFTQQNAGTVADTLKSYSPQAAGQRMDQAIANRGNAYTTPLQAKNFVADMPSDFDPNNVVAGRNAFTGNQQKSASIASALAKAKLDAYGDATLGGNIAAQNNSNQIGATNLIARNYLNADKAQQAVFAPQMQAAAHAGDTTGTIGDLFTMAGMMNAAGGGSGLSNMWNKASSYFSSPIDPYGFSGAVATGAPKSLVSSLGGGGGYGWGTGASLGGVY